MCVWLAFLLFSMKASPTSGLMGRGLGPGEAILGTAVTTEWELIRPQVSKHNCFHLCHLNIALSMKTVFVPSAPAHHAWPGSGQGPSRLVNTCWDHKICSERSYILTEREAPIKLSSEYREVFLRQLFLSRLLASDWPENWPLIGQYTGFWLAKTDCDSAVGVRAHLNHLSSEITDFAHLQGKWVGAWKWHFLWPVWTQIRDSGSK